MKIIHEMRERQAFEQPKTSSPLPIVLGAVIAFGIGMLGVSGYVKPPGFLQSKTTMVNVVVPSTEGKASPEAKAIPETKAAPEAKEVVIDTSARRIGRAETAPLLKACVPFSKLGMEINKAIEPGDLYRLLQSASSMSRVAAMAGIKQKAIDDTHFAALWADVADCIYRQNGWVFCDADNRAFAVEAANTLIRQLSTAAKTEKHVDPKEISPSGLQGQQRAYALQNANAIKGRVLSGVRAQVAEGRLTASDFGMFAPSEIAQVARETKVTRDACAARN